ncbi:MAG: T9SS type A sorting domain-containing protein [Prolixibacteraceae bacterium]|nr:T9SS type A sorting domain-containing protein [Prolixibacteraceae bacterium]
MRGIRTVLFLALILLNIGIGKLYSQSKIWVGSWSCAPYAAGSGNTPPSPYIANNTLRQVVRVSIGGDTVRVKFSNKTCSTPVTMNSVSIAVSKGGSAVDASTITSLTFNGNATITMNPYSSVLSDPVAFPLDPSARIAITIHYGQASSNTDITSHVASRTDSYIVTGDKSTAADFGGATITAHWFHINTIDVMAPDTAGCVGVLGNSITDGYGLSGGLQNRWTDIFSEKLLADERTSHIGVLNLGIGATTVAGNGPTTGLSRYNDDLLTQSGIRWIIMFYGVNDIGGGRNASEIINAYQQIIDDARSMNIKVYGATITPFKGSSYYSAAHENVRNDVNEWIRAPGNFDACIDFDRAIRDPLDTAKMAAEFSNDWLHPNAKGYAFLGNSVNLNLFTEIQSDETLFANAGSDQTLLKLANTGKITVNLNGSRSISWGSPIAQYVWSIDDVEVAAGELSTVDLDTGTHTIKLTITDGDGKTDSDEVTITIVEDSGVWLEAECGTVGSLWDIKADNNASNGKYVSIKPGNNSTDKASTEGSGLLTYSFDIEEAGTYNFYARVLCPNANDDSFWIKMDNGSYAMWNNIAAGEWQWVPYTSGFSLNKGSHTLTIGYREDGAKLDKIWISKITADVAGKGPDAGNCNASSTGHVAEPEMKIYPNPVNDILYLAFSDVPAEYCLFDDGGKILFSQRMDYNNVHIDMTNYLKGIYILKVKNSKFEKIETILKK